MAGVIEKGGVSFFNIVHAILGVEKGKNKHGQREIYITGL
jgi:hypothetical protein